ncbi:hypothetical protein CYMTET_24459, partial [Cymbomonas tetramitiformis]
MSAEPSGGSSYYSIDTDSALGGFAVSYEQPEPKRGRCRSVFTIYIADRPSTVPSHAAPSIHFDIPELGNWEVGHQCVALDDSQRLYQAVVEIPYATGAEYSPNLFKFKYTFDDGTGIPFYESGPDRGERKAQANYYHRHPRASSWSSTAYYTTADGDLDAYEAFLRLELGRVASGRRTGVEFFSAFAALEPAMYKALKSSTENILDKFVKAGELQGGNDLVFCCAGIIGKFGLMPQMYGSGTSSYSSYTVSGSSFTSSYYSATPEPRPWCFWLVQNLEVVDATTYNPALKLGSHHKWATTGLKEAVMRIYMHAKPGTGRYCFLSLVPALKHLRLLPDSCSSKGKTLAGSAAGICEEFSEAVAEVCRAVAEEPADSKLSPEWLSALVKYAPSFDAMKALLHDPRFTSLAQRPAVIVAFCDDYLEDFKFSRVRSQSEEEFAGIQGLLREHPFLKCQAAAVAIFENDDAIEELGADPCLQFMDLCLPENVKPGCAGAELVKAARKWLRRHYGEDSALNTSSTTATTTGGVGGYRGIGTYGGTSSYYGGGYSGLSSVYGGYNYGGTSAYTPSAEEKSKSVRKALRRAVQTWDAVLSRSCFAGHEKDFLFDLGRAAPLRHSSQQVVLQSLCSLDEKPGMDYYDESIKDWLLLKAGELVHSSDWTAVEACELVDKAQQRTSFGYALMGQVITHASASAATPKQWAALDAATLLENAPVWCTARAWAVAADGEDDHQRTLRELVEGARGAVQGLVQRLEGRTCTLKEVQAAQKCQANLLRLAADFSLSVGAASGGLSGVIQRCGAELAAFDALLARVSCYVSLYCHSIGVECGTLEESMQKAQ